MFQIKKISIHLSMVEKVKYISVRGLNAKTLLGKPLKHLSFIISFPMAVFGVVIKQKVWHKEVVFTQMVVSKRPSFFRQKSFSC